MQTVYIKAKKNNINALGETTNKGDIIKTVELAEVTKISTEKKNNSINIYKWIYRML